MKVVKPPCTNRQCLWEVNGHCFSPYPFLSKLSDPDEKSAFLSYVSDKIPKIKALPGYGGRLDLARHCTQHVD